MNKTRRYLYPMTSRTLKLDIGILRDTLCVSNERALDGQFITVF